MSPQISAWYVLRVQRITVAATVLVAACAQRPVEPAPSPAVSNAALTELYEADQRDRSSPSEGSIMDRDAERRHAVDALLARGAAKTSEDYFHAAMIFQHGEGPAEIDRAHALALRAMAIKPTHPKAAWLAAASEDRAHMYRGEPQRFGTQFRLEDGVWVLYKTDPRVTDAERARWGVPPIAEARARAAELNRTAPGGVFFPPNADARR